MVTKLFQSVAFSTTELQTMFGIIIKYSGVPVKLYPFWGDVSCFACGEWVLVSHKCGSEVNFRLSLSVRGARASEWAFVRRVKRLLVHPDFLRTCKPLIGLLFRFLSSQRTRQCECLRPGLSRVRWTQVQRPHARMAQCRGTSWVVDHWSLN